MCRSLLIPCNPICQLLGLFPVQSPVQKIFAMSISSFKRFVLSLCGYACVYACICDCMCKSHTVSVTVYVPMCASVCTHMHVCAYAWVYTCEWRCPQSLEVPDRIPWSQSYTWVLKIKLGSSTGAVQAPNHWAISPALMSVSWSGLPMFSLAVSRFQLLNQGLWPILRWFLCRNIDLIAFFCM